MLGLMRWYNLKAISTVVFDSTKGIFSYYVNMCKVHATDYDTDILSFCFWALELLKNLHATALVESYFSTRSMMLSKYRMALGEDLITAGLIMRSLHKWMEHFHEFYTQLESERPDILFRILRGKRGEYRKKK